MRKLKSKSASTTLMAPVHPGEVLREDFMKPLDLTVNKLALELRVPATRIGEIVHERRRITAAEDEGALSSFEVGELHNRRNGSPAGAIFPYQSGILAQSAKFLRAGSVEAHGEDDGN